MYARAEQKLSRQREREREREMCVRAEQKLSRQRERERCARAGKARPRTGVLPILGD